MTDKRRKQYQVIATRPGGSVVNTVVEAIDAMEASRLGMKVLRQSERQLMLAEVTRYYGR